MSLLRRALSLGAVLLAASSVALLIAPGWLTEHLLDQSETPGDVWLRLLGASGFSLALVHVLIVRKLDDLWWWTWSIVVFDLLVAVITVLQPLAGLADGSAAWPWWVAAGVSATLAGLCVAGLARAGQERPFA
ncbi:MAG TPA: hypothetical protein VE800_06510 [Actinomycetota bacterium]|nr:hypothetical protein [Actinomycetota bacterium]